MVQPDTACILVAEVPGTDRLADALGATEAGHAVDRCMHRIERAVDANAGSSSRRGTARLTARFARADAAVLAACEMLERVQALPPLRGLRMAIRIGLHAQGGPAEQTEAVAAQLAEAAKPGHALASAAILDAVSGGARQFISPMPSRSAGLANMPWPVYPVGRQAGTTAANTATQRNTQKLRIRHQSVELVVDENRPVVLFGRELGNDIVIADPRASRQHARIERTREGFALIDQSTNGTFLLEDGRVEYCVKNEGVPLKGPGRIGCGFSCSEIERDLLFFELL